MTNHSAPNTLLGPSAIRDLLREETAKRQRQLEKLPADPGHVIAAAHRTSVERLLAETAAALRRCEAGTYGRCVECSAVIATERLEQLPWAATCHYCATAE